jgi:hypothetical protein
MYAVLSKMMADRKTKKELFIDLNQEQTKDIVASAEFKNLLKILRNKPELLEIAANLLTITTGKAKMEVLKSNEFKNLMEIMKDNPESSKAALTFLAGIYEKDRTGILLSNNFIDAIKTIAENNVNPLEAARQLTKGSPLDYTK